MNRLCCLSTLLLIVFLLLHEPIVNAQEDVARSPSIRTIYLKNIHHNGKSRFDKDVEIDNFAQKLVELRLAELKFYELKIEDAPKCKNRVMENSVSQPPGQGPKISGDDEVYYVIRASLEIRSAENRDAEVALEYELLKYVQCQPISLIRNAQPFAETEVLKYLNSMAEVLSSILEREQTAIKASVEVVPFTSSDLALQPIATNLTNEVILQLNKASEFEPREAIKGQTSPASDFTLSGQLLIGEKLGLRLTIGSKTDRPSNVDFRDGPNRKDISEIELTAFYKDSSDRVITFLQQVRRSTEESRRRLKNEAEALAQLQLAKTMCGNETTQTTCKQPEDVAAKLIQVVESRRLIDRREELLDAYRLLGTAQKQTEDNLGAATSFDAAIRLLPKESKTEERVNLLNQSGDAWFQAKDYPLAATRYEESLRLAPSQAEVHLGRAKSYRYGNERLKALEVLLGSLKTLPQPQKELMSELEYVMTDLREEELDLARQFLEANKETLPVELAIPMLRSGAK